MSESITLEATLYASVQLSVQALDVKFTIRENNTTYSFVRRTSLI